MQRLVCSGDAALRQVILYTCCCCYCFLLHVPPLSTSVVVISMLLVQPAFSILSSVLFCVQELHDDLIVDFYAYFYGHLSALCYSFSSLYSAVVRSM